MKQKTYNNISQNTKNHILDVISKNCIVTKIGAEYLIDTKRHGVKLIGVYNEHQECLQVIIVNKSWYVPYRSIWNKLDGWINKDITNI